MVQQSQERILAPKFVPFVWGQVLDEESCITIEAVGTEDSLDTRSGSQALQEGSARKHATYRDYLR
jgi:hypothetical protein